MLSVQVLLINDNGDRRVVVSHGRTVDEAVAAAEELVAVQSGDDSYVMSDWEAA